MSKWVLPLFVTLVVTLGSLPSLFVIASQLEAKYLPVAGPAVIEEIDRFEEGWTYFSMSAPKHRECEWRGTKFFLGKRGNGSVPVPFEHLDMPQIRGVGHQFWAESRVQLTPDQLMQNAYANVHHSCGPGLWTVVTHFYG